MLMGLGHRSVLMVGLVRSGLRIFFLNAHRKIPRDKFLDYLKEVLPLDTLKPIFVEVFSIRLHFVLKKARYVTMNECSSWYS